MDVKFTVSGLNEIEKLLKLLPDKPARQALESAGRAGLSVIQEEAIQRAPILEGEPRIVKYLGKKRILIPGTLKRCIAIRKVKEEASKVHMQLYVTKHAWYAHFLEWGTSKMRAQRFMRPALEAKGQQAIHITREVAIRRITSAAEKLASILGTKKRRRRR